MLVNLAFATFVFISCILILLHIVKPTDNEIEKITVTNDEIIISAYVKNVPYVNKLFFRKTENLRYNKKSIKKFNVKFYSFNYEYVLHKFQYYDINLTINDNHYKCQTSSLAIIKLIFKTAKYIPNFSYNIDSKCTPIPFEEIKRIANGENFSTTDFFSFIFKSPRVPKSVKIDAIFGFIVIVLLVLLFLFAILYILSPSISQIKNVFNFYIIFFAISIISITIIHSIYILTDIFKSK